MKHLRRFNESNVPSDEIPEIKADIKRTKERMEELKKQASKDPFGDSYQDIKIEFEEAKDLLHEFEEDLKDSKMRFKASIAKLPFKYSNEQEFKDSLKKVAMCLYDEDKLQPDSTYREATYTTRDPNITAPEGNATGSITVPSEYARYMIVIENGMLVAQPASTHHWGSIPDDKSYAQYGTSGHNNPATTSNMNKSWEVNTIGDVAAACVEMMVIPKKASAKHAKDFAAYLRAGGRDWD